MSDIYTPPVVEGDWEEPEQTGHEHDENDEHEGPVAV